MHVQHNEATVWGVEHCLLLCCVMQVTACTKSNVICLAMHDCGCQTTEAACAGVLILSEFTGASQSLGAGAILVNPWNITDLSAAIGDALTMTDAERRERHRQNYMHITIHTSQTWADTFISELNDTHVEAELRTKHIPPQVT